MISNFYITDDKSHLHQIASWVDAVVLHLMITQLDFVTCNLYCNYRGEVQV